MDDPVLRPDVRNIDVVQNDGAVVDRVDAGEKVEHGRLTGAVWADKGGTAAAADLHRDIVDNLEATEALMHAGDGENVVDHSRLLGRIGNFARPSKKGGQYPVLHRSGHNAFRPDDHHQNDKGAKEDKPAVGKPA